MTFELTRRRLIQSSTAAGLAAASSWLSRPSAGPNPAPSSPTACSPVTSIPRLQWYGLGPIARRA
jgi:hypothetical protein